MDRGRQSRLQRKHALLLRLAHDLSVENTQLRRKEKVMISLLAEQVDYLHNLGTISLLSACDGSSSEATDKQTAAVVAALAADVEAYQLLQQLQQVPPPSNASSHHAASLEPHLSLRHPSGSSCCGNGSTAAAAAAGALGSSTQQFPLERHQQQQHLSSNLHSDLQQQQDEEVEDEDIGEGAVVTTQRLRAAVAPETVLQVSRTPLQQLAVELREVTQKMALLRLAGTGEGVSMSGTLEDCVMEYGKLCMRIHMGKNQQSVELSSINLETLQREQPPPGFWASIAEHIQPSLTTEQVERLAFGFQVYLEKRVPLVSKSQELVQQLQHLLGYQVTQDAATAGAATTHDNISSMPEASAASSSPVPAAQTGTIADAVMRDAEECDDRQQAPNLQQQQQQQCSGSSDSSGSLQCLRRLSGLRLGDVSSPEHLDALLQQLSVCTTQLWEVSRHLIFHWVNTLNTEQMAASITMSFPYWVQPVPLCEYVWRQQQESYADGPCLSACSKM